MLYDQCFLVTDVSNCSLFFKDPNLTPPPTRGETRDEKTERKVKHMYAIKRGCPPSLFAGNSRDFIYPGEVTGHRKISGNLYTHKWF